MPFTFALNAILSLSLISGLYSPILGDVTGKHSGAATAPAVVERATNGGKESAPFSFVPAIPVATHEVWLTAYSSTPEETDDTPFITALGTETRDGIVAANFLPFGTRVKIPDVFGDKVFVVEDRMHPRKTDFMDVWMPTKVDALNLGIRRTKIVVLAPADFSDKKN